ncbi:MAG: 4a-hydroxytetrahydrobiopterin dehydratase [Candidatus Marinimicrobia bacterium]|nr:4a-hydroxytetrahydrobiopterin dehydratase [Candidatus Neomarinimicrobiota bacterium]|tara:strand:+ start:321 stop:599 length:279 start_codon:yes stop_codon:yes gene_type:complete
MELISFHNIQNFLIELPGWKFENKCLVKEFKFNDYMAGITFVNRLAEQAEGENHHPDLEIGWCRVLVSCTSHDLGGVTDKDVMLAKIAEELF